MRFSGEMIKNIPKVSLFTHLFYSTRLYKTALEQHVHATLSAVHNTCTVDEVG